MYQTLLHYGATGKFVKNYCTFDQYLGMQDKKTRQNCLVLNLIWWACSDLNRGLTDYESATLTAASQALKGILAEKNIIMLQLIAIDYSIELGIFYILICR